VTEFGGLASGLLQHMSEHVEVAQVRFRTVNEVELSTEPVGV